MLDLHGISQAAFDLIVASEVTSKAVFNRKYRAPTWPGLSSGATIGIGYDIGQNSRSQFLEDWKGKLPDDVLKKLARACGVTGDDAHSLTKKLQQDKTLVVSWDASLDVFSNHDIPRYLEICRRALPGFANLTPDCQGAILSIVFNRGASFAKSGDRYREMRAIKACIVSGNLAGVAPQIRSMKRLWPKGNGLLPRRDAEAALFEKGLASQRSGFMSAALDEDTGRPVNEREGLDDIDSGDDTAADTAAADEPAADDAPEVITDPATIQRVQQQLRDLGYFEVGKVNGDMAHRTEGAILAFRNENHLPLRTTIDDEFLSALAKAPVRCVSDERANTTAADLRDQGSQTISFTDKAKTWGGRLFGGGFSFSIIASATERLSQISGFKEAVEGLGLSVRTIVLIAVFFGASLVLAMAGLLIWWIADKIERHRVADYRVGKNP